MGRVGTLHWRTVTVPASIFQWGQNNAVSKDNQTYQCHYQRLRLLQTEQHFGIYDIYMMIIMTNIETDK